MTRSRKAQQVEATLIARDAQRLAACVRAYVATVEATAVVENAGNLVGPDGSAYLVNTAV